MKERGRKPSSKFAYLTISQAVIADKANCCYLNQATQAQPLTTLKQQKKKKNMQLFLYIFITTSLPLLILGL